MITYVTPLLSNQNHLAIKWTRFKRKAKRFCRMIENSEFIRELQVDLFMALFMISIICGAIGIARAQ